MIMPFQTMSQQTGDRPGSPERTEDKRKWSKLPLMKICLDVVLFVIGAVTVHGGFVYDTIPYRRGFFCNDESIRYPHKRDTISDAVLYQVGYTLPCLVVLLNEIYETCKSRRQRFEDSEPLKNIILDFAWTLYCRIGVFLFGAYINEIITNVTKIVIGRLRPCFIDICRPDIDCSSQTNNIYTYVADFTCTGNQTTSTIEDARKSFPSGHASFSFYAMLFLIIYLHFCMTFKPSKLLKPSVQLIFLMMAWFTSMSRISDYRHHWSDVVVGIFIGSAVALGTVYFISDFSPKTSENFEISLRRNKPADRQQGASSYINTAFNSKL